MKNFKISISTPIGKNYEVNNAVILNADLIEGRIGILSNHSPLISSLKISEFSIELDNGDKFEGIVDGGIFSVTKESVTILTPRFDFKNEINKKDCENEIKEIEYLLKNNNKENEIKSLNDRKLYSQLKLK